MPSLQQLVDGAVTMVARTPAVAFPLADMLQSMYAQDTSNRKAVISALVRHLHPSNQQVGLLQNTPCCEMVSHHVATICVCCSWTLLFVNDSCRQSTAPALLGVLVACGSVQGYTGRHMNEN